MHRGPRPRRAQGCRRATPWRVALAVWVGAGWVSAAGLGAALDTWHWRNPLPTGNPLHDLALLGGRYVAVGGAGEILTSTDTATWTRIPSGTSSTLRSVAANGRRLVAVGDQGTILTSADGWTWAAAVSPLANTLKDVCWDGAQFVAVGGDGAVLTSGDGTSWQVQQRGPGAGLSAVAAGAGRLVAVGGYGAMLVSTNGVHWEARGPYSTADLADVAYGPHGFVAVGGAGVVLTSPEGEVWAKRSAAGGYHVRGVTYGDGRYVALGDPDMVWTSPDATEWQPRQLEQATWPGRPVYLGQTYLAPSGYGLLTSTDTVNWTNRIVGPRWHFWSMAFGRDTFLGFGREWLGPASAVRSADGVAWTAVPLPAGTGFAHATVADGGWVAVGTTSSPTGAPTQAMVGRSEDGRGWEVTVLPSTNGLWGVACGNGQWVAVGERGTIFRSTDGVSWARQDSASARLIAAVGWGGGLFVAVGEDLQTSPDGIHWTLGLRKSGMLMTGVAYGNGVHVVTAGGPYYPDSRYDTIPPFGLALTSTDGTNWTDASPGEIAWLYGPLFVGGRFVAHTRREVISSPDGAHWAVHVPAAVAEWKGLAFGHDTFVLVSARGDVLQSDPVAVGPPATVAVQARSRPVLTVSGEVGHQYWIQSAEALDERVAWRWRAPIQLETSSATWTDAEATNVGQRFYRAVNLPQ